MKRLALLAAIIGALTVTSAASAGTIYWTPTKMATTLKALQWPHPGVVGGTCKGIGIRHGSAWPAYRCIMAWRTSTGSGKATVWAKPRTAVSVCGSIRSLASCGQVGGVAAGGGDPRVCSYSTNGAQCAEDAAQTAVKAKIGDGDIRCSLTGALVYRCTWSNGAGSGAYSVTFTKGATAWTTTVTP
jgi:hypothetical protein